MESTINMAVTNRILNMEVYMKLFKSKKGITFLAALAAHPIGLAIALILLFIFLFSTGGILKFLLTDKTPYIFIGILILLFLMKKKRRER